MTFNTVHLHPRSRHNVVRLSHNALGWYDRYLMHCRNGDPVAGIGGGYPRYMRGSPCPVGRDGASVQSFYGTVIIIRVIYYDINFVVEMSDKGKSGKELILFLLKKETREVDITLCYPINSLSVILTRKSTNRFHPVMLWRYSCQHN